MKLVLFVVACLLAAVFAAPLTSNQYEVLYTKFVSQYNKQYEMSEFFTRFSIFKSNLDLILAHNAQNQSWTMGLNKFADMTSAEFESMMGLKNAVAQPYLASKNTRPVSGLKASYVDWNAKGVVNKVKDQASCGSCWAFSAIAPFESAIAIKTGKLPILSEQQLVDCDRSSSGCNGGLMDTAYEYLMSSNGSCTEEEYPYTGRDGSCKDSKCSGPKPAGYDMIGTSDQAHQEALQQGPVAVALAASSSNFQFYSSGILTVCPDRQINHGVTLVAYGNENGQDYYTIRNSWGPTWGDKGHIRLATGKSLCGLTTSSFDVQPTY